MNKRKRIHYGNRFEVSAWVPSEAQRDAAHERTEGLVGYFISASSRDSLKYVDDLHTLARSCYLQGAIDAAMVAARAALAATKEKA